MTTLVSDIAIANRALGDCGVDPIDTFEDQSRQAYVVSGRYTQVRDAMLRSHFWNCAKARAQLPALAIPPLWGYQQQFQLPTNCLRVWEVECGGAVWSGAAGCDWPHGFQIEGEAILSNAAGPLNLLYIAQITDPTMMDSLFVDAFAAALAANVCMALTKDSSLRQSLEETAMARLAIARGVNNVENGDHTRRPWAVLAVRQ